MSSTPVDRELRHFVLLSREDQVAAIQRLAANGMSDHVIASATRLSTEMVRKILGEPPSVSAVGVGDPYRDDGERTAVVRAERALRLLSTIVECSHLHDNESFDRALVTLRSELDMERRRLGLHTQ